MSSTLQPIYDLLKEDFLEFQAMLSQTLDSLELINETIQKLVQSGGKRLRPLLVLLSAKLCEYKGKEHIPLAVAMEFFHTATLIHDDVVDQSSLRRGKATINHVLGNKHAVLMGDFLFTRAFQITATTSFLEVLRLLADTSNLISKGELLQLFCCRDTKTNEGSYLEVIEYKTASLFAAAARLGAILAERSENEKAALSEYGLSLGCAFQLIDDALDYCAASDEILGKKIGDDLAEGKLTLPIIYALQKGSLQQQQILKDIIEVGIDSKDTLKTIQHIIQDTGALTYTYEQARVASDRAITALQLFPASPYREGLITFAQFAVNRTY